MFTIRQQQVEMLRQNERERIEDFLVDYLYDHYPEEFETRDAAEVYEFAQYAIDVAQAYDITAPPLLLVYLHLMMLLGEDFDQDSELPWAQEILVDETLDQEEAIARLLAHASPDDELDVNANAER